MIIQEGFLVTETIAGAHRNPSLADYLLLEGDILTVDDVSWVWTKVYPGVALEGFVLSEAQMASLKPIRFTHNGSAYTVLNRA